MINAGVKNDITLYIWPPQSRRRKDMFKVGQKVRVKKDLKVGTLYGCHSFVNEMAEKLGEIMAIKYVLSTGYKLGNSPYTWTDEMLEPATLSTAEIKVGDKVRPTDGSWTITTKEGGLKWTSGIAINTREFIVMATGLNVPPIDYNGDFKKVEYPKGNVWVNDLAIKAIDNGEVIFINSKLVKLIPPTPKPVPFLEAVKAYSEGKTAKCRVGLEKNTYTYQPAGNNDLAMRDESGMGISPYEILNGIWMVEA